MKNRFQYLLIFSFLLFGWQSVAQDNQWKIISTAAIERSDNIEMAGKRVASIVSYDIDSLGMLSVNRQVFFPQLHPFIKEDDPSFER